MGVPKFFRWLSERYPRILQRYSCPPSEGSYEQHFGRPSPTPLPITDPMASTGLPPLVDRLYVDMNGIIHGCSHMNASSRADANAAEGGGESVGSYPISEERIFENVCYYVDRIVRDVARPKQVLFLAVDGVAPRAKLNQQRARRYRAGKEGEIAQTVYDAHIKATTDGDDDDDEIMFQSGHRDIEFDSDEEEGDEDDDDPILEEIQLHGFSTVVSTTPAPFSSSSSTATITGGESLNSESGSLKEVGTGRFTGKFETTDPSASSSSTSTTATDATADFQGELFHSNNITPGTAFLLACSEHLKHFIQRKVNEDPAWQHLTVIFSGPDAPGEGEHKIMQFIREQQQRPDYNVNQRHCIMSQDGDLIMLALATHEPNLILLREQSFYGKRRKRLERVIASHGIDTYVLNPNFEILHINLLRDYLAFEFETSNVVPTKFDIERTIDDFIFLTFLVGNDFLPHMPALDIADEAFDLLFAIYRAMRAEWMRQYEIDRQVIPYLVDSGEIVSGRRLEKFLTRVGKHETSYYQYKKNSEDREMNRELERKFGHNMTPSDEILTAKEEADRAKFRAMIEMSLEGNPEAKNSLTSSFAPVLSKPVKIIGSIMQHDDEDDTKVHEILGQILESSMSRSKDGVDDQDLKGRYYYDKFGFTPFDAEKHLALRKAYIEGLVWNLKYYFVGCVSWEWYYPYHYGPMLSDLVGIDDLLASVSFDGKLGKPLQPFQQLLACLPPSYAKLLPEPYRYLMTSAESPIKEYYPESFIIDMNGKRWPWEAVVLLPFLDASRLIEATASIDTSSISEEDLKRNRSEEAQVFARDTSQAAMTVAGIGSSSVFGPIYGCHVLPQAFSSTQWIYRPESAAAEPKFRPKLRHGVEVPLSGLPTLRDGQVKAVWRKQLRLNVHGSLSRYKTSCLELLNYMPEILSLEFLAKQLIGTVVYINYPHLIEAFVTAVSDSDRIIRGQEAMRNWSGPEKTRRKDLVYSTVRRYIFGEGLVGTGGMTIHGEEEKMDDMSILLNVRPLAGLQTTENGTTVKTYATFETLVPLFVTSWVPFKEDERLANIPARLEMDPYHAADFVAEVNLLNSRKERKSPTTEVKDEPKPSHRRRNRKMSRKGSFRQYSSVSLPRQSSHNRSFLGDDLMVHVHPIRTITRNFQVPRSEISTIRNCRRNLHCIGALSQSSFHRAGMNRGRLLAIGGVMVASWLSGVSGHDPAPWTLPLSHSPLQSSLRGQHNSHSLTTRYESTKDSFPVLDGVDKTCDTPPLHFAHGTTTLSFTFQGGIILAVDSRASLGNFVGSKTTGKVWFLHSHLLGSMAGGAADCSYWLRALTAEASWYQGGGDTDPTDDHGVRPRLSVARASRILANALYANRHMNLSVGTMIVGFDSSGDDDDDAHDHKEGGKEDALAREHVANSIHKPHIYYVDSSGLRIGGDIFAVGSGSTFALSILDTERRYNMTTDEAIALGVKAIRHSTFRDAFSGGYIHVFLVTRRDGWQRVFSEDLARLSIKSGIVDEDQYP